MNFHMTTNIITGKNCVQDNAGIFKKYGKRCLIVTGKGSAVKCGAQDDVIKALSECKIEYEIYNGIEQNPTYTSCFEASRRAIESGAEFIVGIGGGSPLDAAKAVAVLAANPEYGEKEMYASDFEKVLPIIAVGTTAGTGSEVTPVSVITDTKGQKKSFRHVLAYPAVSFGDAKYTYSLADDFTRSTAIDALAHCVESYFNKTANDISRTFALRGIEILLPLLEKPLIAEKLSQADRESLYNASIYGGLAISVTGTAFPHALGYYLSEKKNVAHGTACGIYLPAFIEYNVKTVPEEAKLFFEKLGSTPEKLISAVKCNLTELDVTISHGELSEISPRYYGNKSLAKTPGSFGGDEAVALISELFVK